MLLILGYMKSKGDWCLSQLWISKGERMNKIAVTEEEGGLLRPVVGSTDDRMSLGRKMIYVFDISVKGNQKKVCN